MLGDGCCAFVSISLGKKENEKASKAIGNSLLLCFVISVLLMAIYLIFQNPIITLFGGSVNEATFQASRQYLFWISLGIPFYMVGQCLNPIIRADGNPKGAMAFSLMGAVINIILDPIFIFIFKWGMMGAALATILGQFLTCIISAIYITKMKITKLHKSSFKLNLNIDKEVSLLGMTSFLSQISIVFAMAAIQNMTLKYSALNPVFSQEQYAQIPMAVLGIVMKFFQIVISISVGLAAGCIPVAGYNIGAGLKQRAKKLFEALLISEFAVGLAFLIIVEFFPNQIINLFGAANESSYYRTFAVHSFRIYLCMLPLATVNKGTFIYLQALGKALMSTLLSLVREIVFGVGFALLLPRLFALDGILYSMPVSDLLTFLICLYCIFITLKSLSLSKNRKAEKSMQSA